MEADTTLFQASNGRQPRGFGRWGFQTGNEKHFVVGRYSNSKKAAFKIAQTRGEERVVVLPDKKLAPQGCSPERPETKNMRQDENKNNKDRLMAQAETRKFGKRTRTVIPVKGMKEDEEKIEAPGSRWGTWDRSYRATETMCWMIEAKGIAPMARAA